MAEEHIKTLKNNGDSSNEKPANSLSEDTIWLNTFDEMRQGVVNKFRFLLMCQLMIVWFLGKDAYTNPDYTH